MSYHQVIQADCLTWLQEQACQPVHLSFIDPPFNQGKDYRQLKDNLPDEHYWNWITEVLTEVYRLTQIGGAVYFMQREKNTEFVLKVLRESGWEFQNLIVWKKKTSAVPSSNRYGKQYQIIAYATKGKKPRVFNRLRISPPLPPEYKYERENGIFVTDIWDDIRELTSGYFAGDEAIRELGGNRFHKQQSPVSLLIRIILSSSDPTDIVLDPFAGTGTTLVVAKQLNRKFIGIEIDPLNISCIQNRLESVRKADDIEKYYAGYSYTKNLMKIWRGVESTEIEKASNSQDQLSLFGS